jgi:hypothetical protein
MVPRTWLHAAVRGSMVLLGSLGGAVVGLSVMLAIVVAKARAGFYAFSLDDYVALRWETVPVLLGALLGGALGWFDARTLDRAAFRGMAALIPGAVLGALAGGLVWGAAEGPWAGGIIGSAIGLLAGSASAGRRVRRDRHPLRSGLLGALALLGLGGLGVIGVTGSGEDALEFEDVKSTAIPDPSEVDAVVFLIGDAGEATTARSPLLHALGDHVEYWSAALARDSATSIVFLGDNVYPVGVRDRGHPGFAEDSSRLWSQISLVGGENARRHSTIGLFTTGNHDWGNTSGPAGIERVANMEVQLRLARESGRRVALLPDVGTPGPVVRDLRRNVRILFLDTHWFLQQRGGRERAAFFERLDSALVGANDRDVIVVAHHPFTSAGPHAHTIPGYRTGGIEYLLKRSGSLVQDLNSTVYAELLAGLRRAFAAAERPPLVFAGGHDHSLQIFEDDSPATPRYSVVSGAGSKLSAIHEQPNLAWGASRPGYMMLVFRRDDAVDLFVFAGHPDYRQCAGSEAETATCLETGKNAFGVAYSATILGPSGREVDLPEADSVLGTPWWSNRKPAEDGGATQ